MNEKSVHFFWEWYMCLNLLDFLIPNLNQSKLKVTLKLATIDLLGLQCGNAHTKYILLRL